MKSTSKWIISSFLHGGEISNDMEFQNTPFTGSSNPSFRRKINTFTNADIDIIQ
jgi:hypothetical protein